MYMVYTSKETLQVARSERQAEAMDNWKQTQSIEKQKNNLSRLYQHDRSVMTRPLKWTQNPKYRKVKQPQEGQDHLNGFKVYN